MQRTAHYSRLRLSHDSAGRVFVCFYHHGQRYRFSNAKCLGCDIKPNSLYGEAKHQASLELLTRFKKALDEGWIPDNQNSQLSLYESLMVYAPSRTLSDIYQKELRKTARDFARYLEGQGLKELTMGKLNKKTILDYLGIQTTPSNFNHERARLSSIVGGILEPHELSNPCRGIRPKKIKQSLHKPFEDVSEVLEDIRSFNENLFLCCLLTYGCLLRPHQEIRQLKWGDFNEDLTFISLPGKRNKSGRNRIVPVSPFISKHLQAGERENNIFTGTRTPHNRYYFSTLWSRYKEQSNLIEDNQTLYSFRHTGAIDVFQRTGSLTKLQQVMGHSNMTVSLGYLRNLELPTLTMEDMPVLNRG